MIKLELEYNIRDFFSSDIKNNNDIYIVTSLDLLGFSNFILDNYQNNKVEEVGFLLKYMNIISQKRPYRAALFSDCLFMFMRIDFKEDMLNNFTTMLYDIEHIIENAMQNCFFVRGGICIGECFVDMERSVFYGPGIIKAHLLEEKKADTARIIMDSYDYNQLKLLFSYSTSMNFDIIEKEMLFIENEDFYCFDFIEAMFKYKGLNTDMNECLRRYKYWINICHNSVLTSNSTDKDKYLKKLDYQVQSYQRIISQYNPEKIPKDIASLFE